MRRSHLAPLAVVAVLTLAGAACTDDDSASSQVCDARSDLRDAMQSVADEVGDGNLNEARDELDDVRQDYDELQTAVGDLADDEREELAPQVDDLESQISDLRDAGSVDELSDQVGDVVDSVDSIVGEIGDDLDC